MKKQILITIGREYGSGGHDLAVLLSKRLGIRMLDRELIDELWKNDPEMRRLAQEYDERPVNRILSRKINEFDNSIPHNVAQRQFDMIRQIADSGESAIFVGRCADYALAGRPGLLRIFCRADLTQRIKRIRQRHNLSPEKAALLVAKTDRHRRVYYHHHTGKFWGHSSCYDLTVNTSVLGVEKTAEALEAYIRAFQEQD